MSKQLLIDPRPWADIKDSVIKAFPEESCGFFFGQSTGGDTVVHAAWPVENTTILNKRYHFKINVKDYLAAEAYAEQHKLQLLGVYHSHPNQPAIPSSVDTRVALPDFSYLIISVNPEGQTETRSWRLDDSRIFQEQPINQNH
ncbi:Mov34/MPN/PAD-1 family protein [Pedobacter sp.]|uniref:Mov34/MPN/PAD-1 family protein n=1 Tax=Pedobacter sp. TaxID=1411316 RepID=UPI003D7FD279